MVKKEVKEQARANFDSIKKTSEEGFEYWIASDLMEILECRSNEEFEKMIHNSISACNRSGMNVYDNFLNVDKFLNKNIEIEEKFDVLCLTRYACYLIAQNGSPENKNIALAQTYFAVRTRDAEVNDERKRIIDRIDAREKLSATESKLSATILDRGVDKSDLARIRSAGDKALFEKETAEMKSFLRVPKSRPLADFLDEVVIKAKDFAASMTNFNIHKRNLFGRVNIQTEHTSNNSKVRKTLVDKGIYPEKLPAQEDIKKIKTKLNKQKKLEDGVTPRQTLF